MVDLRRFLFSFLISFAVTIYTSFKYNCKILKQRERAVYPPVHSSARFVMKKLSRIIQPVCIISYIFMLVNAI